MIVKILNIIFNCITLFISFFIIVKILNIISNSINIVYFSFFSLSTYNVVGGNWISGKNFVFQIKYFIFLSASHYNACMSQNYKCVAISFKENKYKIIPSEKKSLNLLLWI